MKACVRGRGCEYRWRCEYVGGGMSMGEGVIICMGGGVIISMGGGVACESG